MPRPKLRPLKDHPLDDFTGAPYGRGALVETWGKDPHLLVLELAERLKEREAESEQSNYEAREAFERSTHE